MKIIVLLIYLFLSPILAYTQQNNSKIIVCSKEGDPLPFTNIFLKNKSKGLISNSNGIIDLNKCKFNLNDTIIFSYIGFRIEEILYKNLIHLDTVFMEEAPLIFNVIDIEAKINEIKIGDGNKKRLMGTTSSCGRTWVTNVSHNTSGFYLKSCKFYIMDIGKHTDSLFLRIHVYSSADLSEDSVNYNLENTVIKTKKYPSNELTKKDIIVKLRKKNKWYNVDLLTNRIYIPKDDFFIGFEVLCDLPDSTNPDNFSSDDHKVITFGVFSKYIIHNPEKANLTPNNIIPELSFVRGRFVFSEDGNYYYDRTNWSFLNLFHLKFQVTILE